MKYKLNKRQLNIYRVMFKYKLRAETNSESDEEALLKLHIKNKTDLIDEFEKLYDE